MPNPYPVRFLDFLEMGMVALDCGSGTRSMPGVVSLDYLPGPGVQVSGDCLALPFADNTFDAVLSQAVLEHVTDPQLAVDEMVRVLRPSGVLFIEAAFMQPVHMEPWHYFSISARGLAHLCRALTIIERGTIGSFTDVIAWLCETAGVPTPEVDEPHPDLYYKVASGVWLVGVK